MSDDGATELYHALVAEHGGSDKLTVSQKAVVRALANCLSSGSVSAAVIESLQRLLPKPAPQKHEAIEVIFLDGHVATLQSLLRDTAPELLEPALIAELSKHIDGLEARIGQLQHALESANEQLKRLSAASPQPVEQIALASCGLSLLGV
jgi:hypothetical protein